MKWILAIAVAALAVGVFVLQRNTVKVSYVNGLETYNHLPGTEYIFQRDCYIFKFRDNDTSWPLVGSHATVPELPETVDARNVGAEAVFWNRCYEPHAVARDTALKKRLGAAGLQVESFNAPPSRLGFAAT